MCCQSALTSVRDELADRYEELDHSVLDSISDAGFLKVNAYQWVVSFGIPTDNVRLLRGAATENHLVIHSKLWRRLVRSGGRSCYNGS